MAKSDIEQQAINTIRTLSMDGVQAANSGHPGTPMALAPLAYVLYNEVLNYDPAQPNWPTRDRFVLSCGHASMLLYSVLHLAGVRQEGTAEPAVSLDDIRNFRQIGSRCPGHPEHGLTSGVEVTTGPLGQGIGASVGMAIASRWKAAEYNRPGFDIFGNNVYAICSDGDLMEGLSSEAASMAGHLKLANLCWIYDDNGITIEGETDLAFSEEVAARFSGYGWNIVEVEDVNDLDALRGAIGYFQDQDDEQDGRPTLIIVKTEIGWGAPHKQGTAAAHGAPLGTEEIVLAKQAYGLTGEEHFHVPEGVMELFEAGVGTRGKAAREAWEAKYADYTRQFPQLAAEFETMQKGDLPQGWDADIPVFEADAKGMASRVSSGKVLNQVAKNVPWLLGGSADLAPSTKTELVFEGAGDFSAANHAGRNFHFGIREHAMVAACNGMALSGLKPYGATFFVFADYCRPSIRMAAMMGLPVFYVFTHDSIGVGEDGPTHQPIEQLASLRAIPNLVVVRPADANEVAEAYRVIVPLKDKPACLVLTRQNLPTIDREKFASAAGLAQGGYTLADTDGTPEVILIGSGSEVSLCLEAREKLATEGIAARVVSLPSWELFEAQSQEYRNSVLPPTVTARVGVEMGIEMGWQKYLGPCSQGKGGRFLGMNHFGVSGPYSKLLERFGFTAENVAAEAKAAMGR